MIRFLRQSEDTKYSNLFNLFQEGLDKLSEDESIKNSTEIYLNVEKIKNADFSDLSADKKYSILLILMKNILPLINSNDLLTTEASKLNFQQTKVRYHLTKTNSENIKKILMPSQSVSHKAKLSLDLPSIKKFADKRFQIPNKPSVLY